MIKQKIKRTCKVCGKEFKIWRWIQKKGWGKYCSNKCRGKSFKYQRKRKGLFFQCENCGKKLYRYIKRILEIKHPHFYCKKCRKKRVKIRRCKKCNKIIKKNYYCKKCSPVFGRSINISRRICKNCRKIFFTFKSLLKYQKTKRRFCCIKCKMEYRLKYPNKNSKKYLRHNATYQKWRKKVLKKYDNTCIFCGSKKELHAHHIKSFSKFGRLRYNVKNGLCLCRKCHLAIHTLRRKK